MSNFKSVKSVLSISRKRAPPRGGAAAAAAMALADRTNLKERTPDAASGERENLW